MASRSGRRARRPTSTRRPVWLWVLAVVAVVAALFVILRLADRAGSGAASAPVVQPEVVARYPHDSTAFTQGLLLADGVLYESTGLYGESSLRRVDLATGRVLDSLRLGRAYFGEGLAALDGRLYQLTWQEGRVFVYDQAPLSPIDTLALDGEGWGLASDGDQLVWSDGSDRLRWLDPATLDVTREVQVQDGGRPVSALNELEVVGGYVLANVWQSGRIAVIDPETGAVVEWLDLTGLVVLQSGSGQDVLNGIAYDAAAGRLLVTGKLWSRVYALDWPGDGA